MLWEEHPDCIVPSELDSDAYPNAVGRLDTMLVYCNEECIATTAARLSGSAGSCGVEAKMLKHWLLCYGVHSELLHEAMVKYVDKYHLLHVITSELPRPSIR